MITALPPPPPERVSRDAVTRGQKRKKEKEGIVGEGSGKNNNFSFTNYLNDSDMEADGEQEGSDGSEEGEVRKKGKGMVDEGQKQEGKEDAEMEQEEETDVDDEYDPHVDDNTINEPNFFRNENRYTSWGKCYFKALEDNKVFGNEKTICHPFYRNEDGFILKCYPSECQNRVFIPDGRCKIGGEFYPMRTLLIHSAHHRLAHYGVSKTYRDISRDTIWPGQWE